MYILHFHRRELRHVVAVHSFEVSLITSLAEYICYLQVPTSRSPFRCGHATTYGFLNDVYYN